MGRNFGERLRPGVPPPPGSRSAQGLGCTCPQEKNRDLAEPGDRRQPIWFVAEHCPVHGWNLGQASLPPGKDADIPVLEQARPASSHHPKGEPESPPDPENHESCASVILRHADALARHEGTDVIRAKHLVIALIHLHQFGGRHEPLKGFGWGLIRPKPFPGWAMEGIKFLEDTHLTSPVRLPLDPLFPSNLRKRIEGRKGRPGVLSRWLPALGLLGDPHVEEVLELRAPSLEGPLAALDAAGRIAQAVLADLKKTLIGQAGAVEALGHLAFRLALGSKGSGPRGVALFLGPPGVGKTLAARTFADSLTRHGVLHADRARTLVVDMTQFTHNNQGTELFGQSVSTGPVASHVAAYPESVVVFNELEKASRSVIQSFLPILDTGIQTCSSQKVVDYQGTVFMFTSNLGREAWSRQGSGSEASFEVDPIELLGISGMMEMDKDGWNQEPDLSREFLSRLPAATVVLFTEPKGHHLLAKILARFAAPGTPGAGGRPA